MTTPLLENELVRKYFGCDLCTSNWGNKSHACFERISYRIFQAMSEPIKKGESWLELYGNGRVELNEGYDDDGFDQLHPYFLRLPDSFQPPPERTHEHYYCLKCNGEVDDKGKALKSPSTAGLDAVEEKIGKIIGIAFADGGGLNWITKELRELVALVRQEGK